MKNAILYIWQLPQHILGATLNLLATRTITGIRYYKEAEVVLVKGNFSGISLGRYIILNEKSYHLEKDIHHELGHSKQSLYLGWFYLLIVGLPSLIMNVMTRWGWLKPENYYKRWPESWADKLGGVNR